MDIGRARRSERPREALQACLTQYHRALGILDPAIEKQLEVLGEPHSYCVVTGQQVGLFGGPLLTVVKAMHAVVLARAIGAVPVFWVASEDHDVGEVSKAVWVNQQGNLVTARIPLPRGMSVESIAMTEPIVKAVRSSFHGGLERGEKDWISLGEEGVTKRGYAASMVRFLASWFRGSGLVFVEPWVLRGAFCELRNISGSFFAEELDQADRWERVFHDAPKVADPPFYWGRGETRLFYREGGRRIRIVATPKGFSIGGRLLARKALIREALTHPDHFSTDVASRVAWQNRLFPVAAYVAGPTEKQYWRQLEPYLIDRGGKVPHCMDRMGMTVIPKELAPWIEKGDLQVTKEGDALTLHSEVLTPFQRHLAENWLKPRNRMQERVLNSFALGADQWVGGVLDLLGNKVASGEWNGVDQAHFLLDQSRGYRIVELPASKS